VETGGWVDDPSFFLNLGGNADYVPVGAGNPKVIVSFVSKYNFWNDVNVVPVVDIGDIPVVQTSLGRARSASKS
jgi:hypothetical protein